MSFEKITLPGNQNKQPENLPQKEREEQKKTPELEPAFLSPDIDFSSQKEANAKRQDAMDKIKDFEQLITKNKGSALYFSQLASRLYAENLQLPNWNSQNPKYREYMFAKQLKKKYEELVELMQNKVDLAKNALKDPFLFSFEIGETVYDREKESFAKPLKLSLYNEKTGNFTASDGTIYNEKRLIPQDLFFDERAILSALTEITELKNLLLQNKETLPTKPKVEQSAPKTSAWSKMKNFFGFGKTTDEEPLKKLSKQEIAEQEAIYEDQIMGKAPSRLTKGGFNLSQKNRLPSGVDYIEEEEEPLKKLSKQEIAEQEAIYEDQIMGKAPSRLTKGGFNLSQKNRLPSGVDYIEEETPAKPTKSLRQELAEEANRSVSIDEELDRHIEEIRPRGFTRWVRKYDTMFENWVDSIRAKFIEKKAAKPKEVLKATLREQKKENKINEAAERYDSRLTPAERKEILKEMRSLDEWEQAELDNDYDEKYRAHAKSKRDEKNKKALGDKI